MDYKLWDRGWSNLSGGEAQRLLLAAAISLDTAEVLLLDGERSAHRYLLDNHDLTYLSRTDFGVGFRDGAASRRVPH